ncbi:MAG: amino acid adenylation domain-containing protein [Acidobacteria bacterium]|nr:amino acid adenylation domain-containing protein [Acidobacteriota bacterium]
MNVENREDDSSAEEVFVFPLSFAQRRLWFLHQLEPTSAAYNMPFVSRLTGRLNTSALEAAFNELVIRHEILRTTFEVLDGEPVQVVAASLARGLVLPLIDLSQLASAESEAKQRLITSEATQKPFDLTTDSLLRAVLVRMKEDEHILIVTLHHIVADGWSVAVLAREVATLYEAKSEGRESPLAELSIQYADYAVWQREWLSGEVLERQLAYWRQQLADLPPTLNLPTDKPRPSIQTHEGAHESFVLSRTLTEQLNGLCKREGVTPYMLLLAAFQVLLARYTGEDEIVVGTPVAGRNRQELEPLIGFFVNTLVLRTSLGGRPDFLEVLRRVREVALGAFAHQDVPFEMLVEESQPERDLSHTPLFQVMFGFQNTPEADFNLPQLKFSSVEVENETARFDLTFDSTEGDGRIYVTLLYNTALFSATTIRRMAAHFRLLLEGIVTDAKLPISQIPLLTQTERHQTLFEWNETRRDFPQECIHQLFEAQVERTPGATAVVFEDEELSYVELNRRANQLARFLLARGVTAESTVGVFMERSVELVVAVLGILKAGGAYVPLDLGLPPQRLSFMLEDARVSLVVTQEKMAVRLPVQREHLIRLGAERQAIANERTENPCVYVAPENLAYTLYTSGSTGQPKGTMIEHRSVANYLNWANRALMNYATDILPQIASLSFDASLKQLLAPLLRGGKVWMLSDDAARQPERLLTEIGARTRVTLNCVPSLWSALLDVIEADVVAFSRESLTRLLLGGERINADLVERTFHALPHLQIWNLYGPTEITSNSNLAGILPHDDITIGLPIDNTQVYILSADLEPVPVGVAGPIYIGGAGLARGYLQRPDLTAERFIPNPFSRQVGARLYHTGDLGRRLPDGRIEFLGRIDEQVKVRGIRIEPGEIEATLGGHVAVRAAAVVASEDQRGEMRLVAYVAGEPGQTLRASELQSFLKEKLPAYMLPSAFVILERMPLTPGGKVNRRALPPPETAPLDAHSAYEPPRTPVAEILTAIWAELLHLDKVGIRDNFFARGGHSLLATQVVARVRRIFGVEIPLRSLFEAPTLDALATQIEASLCADGHVVAATIKRIERSESSAGLPLSYAQQRLWFIQQLDPRSAAYNIPAAVRMHGRLDIAALEQALSDIVRRHEILRTTFAFVDDRPVQVVAPGGNVLLSQKDLSGREEGEREASRLVREEAQRPFDLSEGPLFRATLVLMKEDEHILIVTLHHIVADGWSVGLLVREVAAHYAASKHGTESGLEKLSIQYADYAVWQREWLSGEVLERQLAYWREQLAGAPPALDLPTDYSRPPVKTFKGATSSITLTARLTEDLKALSRREGVTLFMLLLAAFQVLLARYTGEDDIVVGTPVAGRGRAETENLIGLFINMLVLRTDLSGNPTFRELLKRVREVALGAYMHQDLPVEKLVDELNPERSLGHAPLFDIGFDFLPLSLEQERLELPGLTVSAVESDTDTAKFDLVQKFIETNRGLVASLNYSTDLFDEATIKRMLAHLEMLLEAIALDSERPISELSLLTDAELQQLLWEWNDTATKYADDKCIHELFEEQVRRTPESVAVVCGARGLTYGELNTRANQLAHYLRGWGVGAEIPVGLSVERSLEMIVGLLGILKAGGAYVPLDASYPLERLSFMIEETAMPVLLTQEHLLDHLPAHWGQVVCLDTEWNEIAAAGEANPERVTTSDNLAYVIYTSGSTGVPKGVELAHRGLINMAQAQTRAFSLQAENRVLQFASLSFDASIFEIVMSFAAGATLYLESREKLLPGASLVELLREKAITNVTLPPSALALLPVEELPDLQTIVVAGEACGAELVARWATKGRRFFNAYGPSEATVWATVAECSDAARRPPIGRPIDNVEAYILDADLRPVPVGVAGELYIGGAGLARCYSKRPELTAARFIPHPLSSVPGRRLYRSGDRARYLANGEIEFLGRFDQQVKVRGFRIELGEIETALAMHPAVLDSVVIAREDASEARRLIAYVVPREQSRPAVNELRDFLSARLPEYMLPSAFVFLESLPVMPNGKVDRRSLPAPNATRPDMTQSFVVPRTALEKWLTERWCGVLGLERIGVDDNFFELGGDSIKAAVLVNRLQEEIGKVVHVVAIFDAPTISRLASYLEEHCGDAFVNGHQDDARTDALPRVQINEVDETKIEHLRRLVGLHAERHAVEGRENLSSTRDMKNPPVLFVLSPPRSGSTLLRVMLGGHSRLFAPPELELLNFRTMSRRRAVLSGRDSFWLEGAIRAVMEVKGCSADTAKAIIEEYEIAGASTQQFYRAMQEWLGARMLVDKTPSYAMNLEVLRYAEREFDGAKYLHLIRRPQAMIHSFEEAGIHQIFPRFEHPFKPREVAELIWTLSQRNIREFLAGLDERRQHALVFEELIAEPRRVLKGVCEFLGLAFEEEMLEPYRDKKRRMTDGIHEASHMLGDITFHQHRHIEAGVGERWRKSTREYLLGEVTLKEAEALGYDREEQSERKGFREGETSYNFDVTVGAFQSLPAIAPHVTEGKLQTFPLSFAQERLWFLDRLTPGSAFYNCPAAVRLTGQLDVSALERTLGEIIRRHAVLRARFPMIDGQPVQLIDPFAPFRLTNINLRDSPEAEREAAARLLATEEARRPFNLERGPVVRATLIGLDETEHVLLLTMHHIVADGWSVEVLVREVATLYEALRRGEESPLAELSIQYADYAVWQGEWLSEERLESELAYWKRQLNGAPAVMSLPTDRPRPTVQTFHGASCPVRLTKEASLMLRALSQHEGTTMFVTLLTAFQALLARYTGEDDIIVGTPISGRHRLELETLVGFFVNTLVIRTDTSNNPTFRELLRRVQKVTLEAFAHQDVPFEKIVEALQPERSLSHDPLFQVLFSVQNMPEEALELHGLTVSALDVDSGTTKFDLSLSWSETEEGLSGALLYNTALFDAPTIERMGRHLERMLQSFAAHPEQLITEAPLLGGAERHSLLDEWSGVGNEETQQFMPLHELFEAQAKRAPHNVAIISDERQLAYAELNARANGLAHHLRAEGVRPESLVGVFLERSVELVTALLGILKAGAVYVPLDPAYPPERLAHMLDDLTPTTIITSRSLRSALPVRNHASNLLCLDEENEIAARQVKDAAPHIELRAENLAYVIYTSGSTGRPKGVCVSHGAASNHFATARKEYGIDEGDRALQFASPNFDVSLEQMLVPLTSGAAIVLTDTRALTKSNFWNTVRRFGVTMLNLPPAYWSQIVPDSDPDVDAELAQQLKLVLIGGDTMPPETLRLWQQSPLGAVRLLNGYGPTETTITATLFEIPPDFDEQSPLRRVSIGRPLINRTAYILDKRGAPVPVGVHGELHLGGASLARGYLHLPHLTAERFVPDPFGRMPGARLYKTGDVVRFQPDGNIEFLGRTDQQVKIRGYRIETEEIEWTLKEHPTVRETIVIAREDKRGDKELVAYIVAHEPVPSAGLRNFMKGKLPEYMIPTAFVFLESLPLTPNGKLNRRALPAPSRLRAESKNDFVAPRDILELQLCRIWEELLGVEPVDVRDDFFELGGHSLLAVRLMARVEQVAGRTIPLSTLFTAPTVEALAGALRAMEKHPARSSLVAIQPHGALQPLFCVHAAGGNVFSYVQLAQRLGREQPFYGLVARGVDGEQEPLTHVEEMAAAYVDAVRAVQPHGPYLLGGWSLGGVIAFEMTRQFQAHGETVNQLVLFDSVAPDVVKRHEEDSGLELLANFATHLGLMLNEVAPPPDNFPQLEQAKQLAYVLEQLKHANRLPLDFDDERFRRLLHVYVNNVRAVRSYRPTPLPIPTALLCSEQTATDEIAADDPTLGWRRLTTERLTLNVVAGDHFTMLREPHVSLLAVTLKEILTHNTHS